MKDYINQNTARMEKILATSAKTGLSLSAVAERKKKYGKNFILPSVHGVFWRFLAFLARNVAFYVMVLALAVGFFCLPSYISIPVCALYVSYLILAFVLFFYRDRQYRFLQQTRLPYVEVIRGGRVMNVSPEELVVGDLFLLSEGSVLYVDAHVVSDEDMEVFCEREEKREVLIKHGGACFDECGESFNMLCMGDIVRGGEGLAFVTRISRTAPKAQKEYFHKEKTQSRLCRLSVRLSAAASLLSLLISLFTFGFGTELSEAFLCAAIVMAISPAAWCELLFDFVFLARNRYMLKKKGVFFSSMQAAQNVANVNCFLLPTRSVFQSSHYTVKSFENGIGTRISEKSSRNTPELSLISSALLAIRERYSMTTYEENLLAFCKKHSQNAVQMKLDSVAFSEEYEDLSIASFYLPAEGRSFSFVGGDPEILLSLSMYVSDDGKSRFLDEKARQHLISSVRKLKKNGYRLMAYAETQARVNAGVFPRLARDMKLLGFFILGELPDTAIANALRQISNEKKKCIFFHDGNDPSWILENLPILKNAPVLDGNDDKYLDEIRVFAADLDLPFCVCVHMTPTKRAQIVRVLESFEYVSLAYGDTFSDHRMMCAASVAMTHLKSPRKRSVGIVHTAAEMYVCDGIAAQTSCVDMANGLLQSFGGMSAYFCAALLARSILLLIGVLFGYFVLPPVLLALFAFAVDMSAFWCLSYVRSDFCAEHYAHLIREKHMGFFIGGAVGVVTLGALAVFMAIFPHYFGFSYVSFAVLALLLMLNVGVLRFASLRFSRAVLLFPCFSVLLAVAYFSMDCLARGTFFFAPELLFWMLLPTVALLAAGGIVPKYILRNTKKDTNSETQRSNDDE